MAHKKSDVSEADTDRADRFVNQNVSELLEVNRTPIDGYLDHPLCSLEESVEPIMSSIPSLSTSVCRAKDLCNKSSNLLTTDESAAIYLYTMPTIFYKQLNKALRDENRQALKRWFSFIRLIMSGLEKLPDITGISIWRGVAEDTGSLYSDNETFKWWSFNSCTRDLKVIKHFIRLKGTAFSIECKRAKDISDFSAVKRENEVILLPGTSFRVKTSSLFCDSLYVVHLEEVLENKQTKVQDDQQVTTATEIYSNLPIFVETAADAAVEHFKNQLKWKRYSSLHTYLALVNNSDIALYLEVSDVNEDHWDGVSRPRTRFHNVKIPCRGTLRHRLEIKANSSRATSSMVFRQDGRTDVAFHFRTDQWAARAPEEKNEEVNFQNGWKAIVTVGMENRQTLQYQFSKT
jgi:hypothetical protein